MVGSCGPHHKENPDGRVGTPTGTRERCHVDLLVILTLAASLLYALPLGLVLGFDRFWHVAALYLGSVAMRR